MLFPIAYLSLTSAVTVLLILLGLADRPALAAEFAVIQGALLATFHAFSANTRSLILQGHEGLTADRLLAKRALALPLLCAGAYLLCVGAAGVSILTACLLILRRACEWLAEVRLCEIEVAGDARAARRVLAVQSLATVLTAATLIALPALETPALLAFALTPLIGAAPRMRLSAFNLAELRATLRDASPHIGSTAVMGVSIYVLRLIVFLIAGAQTAGLLFTAFALGSFFATIFANVLGPTLALQRARDAHRPLVKTVLRATAAMAVGGTGIAALAWITGYPDWMGKPGVFWLALGLSLLGGAIMVVAQVQRLRIFQAQAGEMLFGPDVLRNLMLIIAAPALYYLVQPTALAALYFVDAALTLFFYWSAKRQTLSPDRAAPLVALLDAVVAALLLLPLFFLLRGDIYHTIYMLLDSGGSLLDVPLPIALPTCFVALALIGRYSSATVSLGVVFFLFVGMVLTTVVSTDGSIDYESRKLLLLFQFLVPSFALVLGQIVGKGKHAFRATAAGFTLVLALIVPLQLVKSYGYAANELNHYLWLFSIYQHRQFVPVVFVAAYVLVAFAGWDVRWMRWCTVLLAPLMGYYVGASYSTLALVLLLAPMALLTLRRRDDRCAWLCAVLIAGTAAAYLWWNWDAVPMREKYNPAWLSSGAVQSAPAGQLEVPSSLSKSVGGRLNDWTLYSSGISEGWHQLLFGHARAFGRDVSTSAHNYYLDFLYNFGLLAFLPYLWLVAYTLMLLWRERRAVWLQPPLLGLALIVLFAIAVDNNFKVTFRQPYPGIFFFFLWGLLISRLQALRR